MKGKIYFAGYLPFFVHLCYFYLDLFKKSHTELYVCYLQLT